MTADTGIVTVLIVNWNAGDYITRCLETIPRDYPVVIVDNNSEDGSVDKVLSHFPAVKVLKSPINLGFSAGNNLGLREITTKYVLFLNPDTEIIGDAINVMVDFLESHPDYAAAGPRIIDRDGQVSLLSGRRHFNLWVGFCEVFLLDKIFSQNRWLNYWHIPEWDRKTSRDVDCLVGCAMLMRTDIVKELGGFDDRVPLYLDDIDLCRKITESGGRIRCVIEASVWHMHNVSCSKAPVAWINHVNFRARYVYLKKYANLLIANCYLILVWFGGLARATAFLLAYSINDKYRSSLIKSFHMLTFPMCYWKGAKIEKVFDKKYR
jgi:GT2 family glycosyltransferase